LPPTVPLPPQEELEEFDAVLQAAIDDLQSSSAKSSATTALQHLAHVADIAACVATSWPEFWSMLVHTAKLLISILTIESAIVKNVLVQSLTQVARQWNETQTLGESHSTAELAHIAGGTFDRLIAHQEVVGDKLEEAFAQWLDEPCIDLQWQDAIIQSTDRNHKTSRSLTILTIDPHTPSPP
jgi:hypothetical protein